MNNIKVSIEHYYQELSPFGAKLIAVSKTKPNNLIEAAYNMGHRDFGENKVQELVRKHEELPQDINWHMIGHLQRNKVKFIAPFVHLIHSVDSFKLLKEISKEGIKNERSVQVLLQVHIAEETSKHGFSSQEISELLNPDILSDLTGIRVIGLMGMATNTTDTEKIKSEFTFLKSLFDKLKAVKSPQVDMQELSMGMSGDYQIALACGATMVRIGSSIFGERNYGQATV
ncbi:MAG: YggS family pyridoxal phosphate-dependent enzyme [Cyclobacteriaceae bacterium]